MAGNAHLGRFDDCLTGPESLPDPQRTPVQGLRGNVLAKCSIIDREALSGKLINPLGSHQQNCALSGAMKLRMPPAVAGDALPGNDPLLNRAIGHAARRDTDLHYNSSHFFTASLIPATFPSVS